MNSEIYKEELNKILKRFGGKLDITKTEYEMAVKSYNAVGKWLSDPNSNLAKYNPEILPQGSFMLGTMIKPVNPEDDLDIDLVCKLDNIPNGWSQKKMKDAVGDRIKAHDEYANMLKDIDGGRRCWTLEYAESSNYHMDILPSITNEDYNTFLNESFSMESEIDMDKLAIRITDKESHEFEEIIPYDNWDKSNPFGYAKWFFKNAFLEKKKLFSLESIQPVREFDHKKLPLQIVVQLLKRHRDIMFMDEKYNTEHKPISIIITTLAARSYNKSSSIIDAFENIVNNMENYIEDRWNEERGKYEKWVVSPVNDEENYANKWADEKLKEDYFFLWLDELKKDLNSILNSQGKGYNALNERLAKQYGENLTSKIFEEIATDTKIKRSQGVLKMATGTGLLGESGTKVKKHDFYGN